MSKAHRKRTEPKLLPKWTMGIVLLFGVAGLFLGGVIGPIMSTLATIVGIAYFVQHWRHAGWIVETAAQSVRKG